MPENLVGGQAVLEGVMMRAPGVMSVAVRRQDGSIEIFRNSINTISPKSLFRKPFFRGMLALVQALNLGFKALNFSSAVAMADIDNEEKLKKGESIDSTVKNESMSAWSVAGVIAGTLILGVGFFFLLPLYLTNLAGSFMPSVSDSSIVFNIVDGAIRVIFLLVYISSISLIKDIRRVFEYHGAEHKSIATYEAGLDLTVENARGFSKHHPRCGTAFLLMVMVVAIFMFSLIPSSSPFWAKALSRIVLLPVIAAISFELIKKAGESTHLIFRILIAPGLWLQRITTREPDDEQLDVGLTALRSALEASDSEQFDLII